jgi:hypothetical protein
MGGTDGCHAALPRSGFVQSQLCAGQRYVAERRVSPQSRGFDGAFGHINFRAK